MPTLRGFASTAIPVTAAIRDPSFVGSLGATLEGLGKAGVLGKKVLESAVKPKGNSEADRVVWWAQRVGLVTSLLSLAPELAGPISGKLPASEILGAAGAGLVLCGIAGEYGLQDVQKVSQMLAAVLFDRHVDDSPDSPGKENADPAPSFVSRVQEAGHSLSAAQAARVVWGLGVQLKGLLDEISSQKIEPLTRRGLRRAVPYGAKLDRYRAGKASIEQTAHKGVLWLDQWVGANGRS